MSDKELIFQGNLAFKAGHLNEASKLLFAAFERFAANEQPVPAASLALYATCLAFQGKVREGLQTCKHAAELEPHNADVYLNMARIYLKGDSRRMAVEALDQGLSLSPRHPELLLLRRQMGARKPPVIGFLSRENPVNVTLGRMRRRRQSKKR